MKLIHLIDSWHYATTNCWQRQLLPFLRKQCEEHVLVDASSIAAGHPIPEGDVYLSTLKLRTIHRLRDQLGAAMQDRPIHVYDQDPWESFIDSGNYRGAYKDLTDRLNVSSFILTSAWWAAYVSYRGYPTRFAKMWMDPSLCDDDIPFFKRPIKVGFMGGLHGFRKEAIDKLASMGVHVHVLPPANYDAYLQKLSHMQFFFHAEDELGWKIDGQPIRQNALWAKEIEIAARGCYALRRFENESLHYNLGDISCIKTYMNLEEVPDIIRKVWENPLASQHSRESVEFIKTHQGWFQLTDLLQNNVQPLGKIRT